MYFSLLILCRIFWTSWIYGSLEHICNIFNKCVKVLICKFHHLSYFLAWVIGQIFLMSSNFILDTGHCKLYVVGCLILFYSFKECWALFWQMVKSLADQFDPFIRFALSFLQSWSRGDFYSRASLAPLQRSDSSGAVNNAR